MRLSGKLFLSICVAASCVALSPTAASALTPVKAPACPNTFTVLHNDHIGPMQVPAGAYQFTTNGGISCVAAATRFSAFLYDFDGVLPRPWRLNARSRTFTRGNSGQSFTAKPVTTPVNGLVCPSTFQVLHNDRIGNFAVPAGQYTITRLSTRVGCAQAAIWFAQFLDYPNGKLPKPWSVDAKTGTFREGVSTQLGFSVKRTGNAGGGGGRYPFIGAQCPGSFTVDHNDMIGPLFFPRGKYKLILLPDGGITCTQAGKLFAQFLDYPNGRLPRPWVLNANTGSFTRGRGSNVGFVVKPL